MTKPETRYEPASAASSETGDGQEPAPHESLGTGILLCRNLSYPPHIYAEMLLESLRPDPQHSELTEDDRADVKEVPPVLTFFLSPRPCHSLHVRETSRE